MENEKDTSVETTKKDKSTKIMIGIIAVLALVIVGLIILVVAGGKKKDKKDNSSESDIVEATSSDADKENDDSEEATTEETTEAAKGETKADCYVTLASSNNWNDGSAGQIDVSIVNGSSEAISNWEVHITGATGVSVDSAWNAKVEVKGEEIVITNSESWNVEIAAGQTDSSIGFIVTADSADKFNSLLKNGVLYVDGKVYAGSTSTSKEETTEETTEEVSKAPAKEAEDGTPVANHGKLKVDGVDIVDASGKKYQLKGMSTHGIAWFPEYVNKDCFQTFRDDFGANLIRIAMYSDENMGYCSGGDKTKLKKMVNDGVDYATDLGMYVIIDWHVLGEGDPNVHKDEAKAFFDEMSKKYADYDNVIYEICNEPNGGVQWSAVKKYAEEVIPVIRANDKDAIIIVGTPTWSQDVDIAANDPIKGYDNIMYAVHFYAATHTDSIRNKVTTARSKGLAVFVSECSICDASGNGAIDYGQADKWFKLINDNNISYAFWSISNKNETSALLKSSCNKKSGFTDDDLSDAGKWYKKTIMGN